MANRFAKYAQQPTGAPMAQQPVDVTDPSLPQADQGLEDAQKRTSMANTQSEIGNRAESMALQQQREAREQAAFQIKQHSLAQTGGVDTTQSGDTAAYLTIRLENALRSSDDLLKRHPDALKPGWMETAAGVLGPRAEALATPKDTQDARNALRNTYKDATDAALTLATGAAYTPQQRADFIEMFAPQVTDGPETLANKRRAFLANIAAARAKSGASQVMVDKALAAIDKLYPSTGSADDQSLSGGASLGNEVSHKDFPAEGQSAEKLWLSQHPNASGQEYADFRTQLDKQLGLPSAAYDPANAQIFMDNVRKAGGRHKEIPPMEVPLNSIGKAAADASGSETGTFLMNMGNAGSLGAVELLAGQSGRDKLKAANEASPNAAAAGDIIGGITGGIGVETGVNAGLRAAGKEIAPGAARLGVDMASNALYGGARGFNHADEGDGLSGAALGAGEGAAAAAAGHLVSGGAKSFMGTKTRNALEDLSGVDLTLPQELGLGRGEEVLNGLPFVRGAIENSQKSLNLDNANRALGNLKGLDEVLQNPRIISKLPGGVEAGTTANAAVKDAFDTAYESLWPKVQGRVDTQFAQGVNAAKIAATARPAQNRLFREELAPLEKQLFDAQGNYTGTAVKDVRAQLTTLKNDWRSMADQANTGIPPSDYRAMADTAKGLRDKIDAMVARNQPEVGGSLAKIDQGYRHMKTVFDASNRGMSGAESVYGPGQLLTSIKKLDQSADKGASATGRAFDQPYAESAAHVMGSKTAPEGVSLRNTAYTGAALTGGSFLSGAIPAAAGTVAALAYMPGVKQVTRALLLKRGKAIDNKVVRQAVTQALAHKARRN